MLKDAEYEQFKKNILSLGPVLPGTLRTVYLRCGKKNCRCQEGDEKKWHGPYLFWDRKEEGRLSSRSVSGTSIKIIRGWINNRKILERIVYQMLQHGVKRASQIDKPKKGLKIE